MDDGGFEVLATTMPRLIGLKRIFARNNACGDKGARATAMAVWGSRGLETLDMSFNPAVGVVGELRVVVAQLDDYNGIYG